MPLPARRLLKGVLLVTGLLVLVLAVRLTFQWRQALADVDAMIVTPMVLPSVTSVPVAAGAAFKPTSLPVPTPEPELPDSPLNILLMGTDARPGDTDPTRTDAVVLVHLDRKDGHVSMLSLPRDLWVTYPGYGNGRVNGAYARGEHELGPGGGAALAKATVGKLTGLTVHHFVLVNFAGFKTVIDRLGGISIDVPKEIDDPRFPTENYGTIAVHFDVGQQLMNGERALIYARTRHADSDFGRNQRQQQVLMAMFERVRQQGLLQQLTSVENYTGALRDYIRTDMPRNTMLDLARWGRNIRGDDITPYAVDPSMIVALDQPATFAAEPRAMRQLMAKITGLSTSSAGGTEP